MKVAIVIGVSKYTNLPELPACANDSAFFQKVTRLTGSYEECLLLANDDTTSGVAKDKLVAFLEARKGKQIDEILFYYSGHGDFDGSDFYYLWSDYDSKRRRQTSLENKEVDSLLKMLQPSLTVKIVDACHSGVSYVKDPGTVELYLKNSKRPRNRLLICGGPERLGIDVLRK